MTIEISSKPTILKSAAVRAVMSVSLTMGVLQRDDTNATVDSHVNADMIVFATPEYWWGVTAQLKLVIDKCYCKGMQLKDKKVGFITIGAARADDMQYELISRQFKCIADHLGWAIIFNKAFSAYDKNDLTGNASAIKELESIGNAL